MKKAILDLRDSIKTAAEAQVALRKDRVSVKVTQPKSDERSRKLQDMHWHKLRNRASLRELYLAYAYVRGRSYASTEQVADPEKAAHLDFYLPTVLKKYGIQVTREQMKAWLMGELPKISEIAEVQHAAE